MKRIKYLQNPIHTRHCKHHDGKRGREDCATPPTPPALHPFKTRHTTAKGGGPLATPLLIFQEEKWSLNSMNFSKPVVASSNRPPAPAYFEFFQKACTSNTFVKGGREGGVSSPPSPDVYFLRRWWPAFFFPQVWRATFFLGVAGPFFFPKS